MIDDTIGKYAINATAAEPKIKVILILSMAYTGTTWITLVAGSHEDAVCLGAGDRVLERGPTEPERLCLIHGEGCRYWPDFFAIYNPEENFFVQLAARTGKRAFVINNPTLDTIEREMRDPRIDLRVFGIVRDGRASLASAMRHTPERVQSVYQSALAWLYRGTLNLERKIKRVGEKIVMLRYEDMVRDPQSLLDVLTKHTGLTYDRSNLRYWESGFHLPSGNTGAIDTLIRLQGGEGLAHRRKDHYDDLVAHLRETDGVPKLDESWKQAYDEVDLAAYDFVAGKLYEAYGYPRPDVGEAARTAFQARYQPPAGPQEALENIAPWRAPADSSKHKLRQAIGSNALASSLWQRVRSQFR